jgi:Methyltransferase domain
MGATGKSLSRIMALADGKLLPLGARIAELGTQNLWCAGDAAVQFLRFFQERGAKVSMTETEAIKVANGGYLGSLLSGVGFDYTAFDIFEAPNTRLMDLNIHFVPSDLQSKFDLVTNYGTTEHVLNQMLAMRSVHDLAKPGGLIHHDLPFGGYYLHCYFKYNAGVFHDLATANGYRLIFQEISSGKWRQTPSALRDAGFADRKFRDYGIEIVVQKTTDAAFKIPVDNISSAVVSEAAWTSGETNVAVSPVLPVDPKTLLARMPFRTVHAAYWSRVKNIILDNISFRK